jgi:hypothetical protein
MSTTGRKPTRRGQALAKTETTPFPEVSQSDIITQAIATWQPIADTISASYMADRLAKREQEALTRGQRPIGPGRLAFIHNPHTVAALLAGLDTSSTTPQQAGGAIGLSHDAVTDALTIGRRHRQEGVETAHALFAQACEIATERKRQRLLASIDRAGQAGPQHWTAHAWLLERGYGNDYRLQQGIQAGGVVVNIGVIGAGDVQIGLSNPQSDADTVKVTDISRDITDAQPAVIDVTTTPVTT